MSFSPTDVVHLAVYGAGVTSYEPAEIEDIDENGVMTLVDSERQYDAVTGRTLEPSMFGFVFTVKKGPMPDDN